MGSENPQSSHTLRRCDAASVTSRQNVAGEASSSSLLQTWPWRAFRVNTPHLCQSVFRWNSGSRLFFSKRSTTADADDHFDRCLDRLGIPRPSRLHVDPFDFCRLARCSRTTTKWAVRQARSSPGRRSKSRGDTTRRWHLRGWPSWIKMRGFEFLAGPCGVFVVGEAGVRCKPREVRVVNPTEPA